MTRRWYESRSHYGRRKRAAVIYGKKLDVIMAALPLEVALTEKSTRKLTHKMVILNPNVDFLNTWKDLWVFQDDIHRMQFYCHQAHEMTPDEFLFQLNYLPGEPKYMISIERLHNIAMAGTHYTTKLIWLWVVTRANLSLCDQKRMVVTVVGFLCASK